MTGIKLVPATLNFSVWVYDTKCTWAQDYFLVSFECPAHHLEDFTPVVYYSNEYKYSSGNPLSRTYHFEGVFTGSPATTLAGLKMTWVSTPTGSSYIAGQTYGSSSNTTFIPDVSGDYTIQISYNDGCGDDYVPSPISFNVPCPTFILDGWSVTADSTIDFNDQQTVRLEALGVVLGANYTTSDFVYSWTIISAPADSVYYVYDTTVLIETNSTVNNITTMLNSNVSVTTSKFLTSSYYRKSVKTVKLDPAADSNINPYGTCFRPDIGGAYTAQISFQLKGTTCYKPKSSVVTVRCSVHAPDLSSLTDRSIIVDRDKPTRVWLNASDVSDLDTVKGNLIYNWKILYPATSVLVNGIVVLAPKLHSPLSMVSSFWVPQANVDYIVELSVSDHCNVQTKNFTIHTTCSVVLPLQNVTLATTYDGLVPIQLMSFAYDHTYEVSTYLAYPKCQTHQWVLYDYSTTYSDSLLNSESTAFTKTPGFAGLIFSVVFVAVAVPLLLWMYFTKKACFKNSGSSTSGV